MKDFLASLPAVLQNIDTDGQTVEAVVFAAWKRCVEGSLAEHVVPIHLENKRLVVAVANETWRKQVSDLGPAIVGRLNAAVGSKLVRFIDFTIDDASVREHRRGSKGTKGSIEDWIKAGEEQRTAPLREAAELIADPDLRSRFLAAASSSLAGRKRYGR